MWPVLILALLAYILGSVPFGFLMGRVRGIDLRQVGSGNIGATNVYRALGGRMAILVFLLEVGKGLVGTRVIPLLGTADFPTLHLRALCGIAVMVGSIVSVFMRFRGGKGVATAVGVFLGLAPVATAACLGIWAALVGKFRYVSLGSVCGAVALPVLISVMDRDGFTGSPVFYLSVLVGVLVVVRHRSNITRLVQGREHRIGRNQGGRP